MAVQEQGASSSVFAADVEGEFVEVGDIPVPVVDPDEGRIVHVAYGMAVAALFQEAYGISGEQEIPDDFAVFGCEFGETV